jgi:hypothetical protein
VTVQIEFLVTLINNTSFLGTVDFELLGSKIIILGKVSKFLLRSRSLDLVETLSSLGV